MALHSDTEIYKAVVELAKFTVNAVRQMPRDVKLLLGQPLRDEAIWMSVLVMRINIARDQAKLPHLVELLEHLEIATFTLRLAKDMGFIAPKTWANSVPLTASIGKQAHGLKAHYA